MISFIVASHLVVGSQDSGALSIARFSVIIRRSQIPRKFTVLDVPNHSEIAPGDQDPVYFLKRVVGGKPCAISMQGVEAQPGLQFGLPVKCLTLLSQRNSFDVLRSAYLSSHHSVHALRLDWHTGGVAIENIRCT